nr:MAG TPA: Repressor protein CI [Caudoviricetes sp.]DAR69318.1 MAG TPA: Repressor protein CI [Caudoviricetes sp.]
MEINDLIFKIRKDSNFTIEEMAKRLEISTSYVNEIEKGRRKISKKIYNKLIGKFPDYKKELERTYLISILSNTDIKTKIEVPKSVKLPVYGLASAGNGEIDAEHYEMREFLLPSDFKMPRGLFVLEIDGDSMEPVLYDRDKVLVDPNLCPTSIEGWKNLNKKITIVSIDDKRFVKKVVFKKGKMFLYSFNEDLYPELEIKEYEEIYCVGVVSKLIQRDMISINF